MSALRKDGGSVKALKALPPTDAVEEKSPAVEESSHGVEESSHGGLFLRRATPPKIDAT